jgi:hypothetical protein
MNPVTDRFWDRLGGRSVPRMPERVPLGRYQLAAPGVVNGRDAATGTRVAPTGSGRRAVDVGGVRWSGSSGQHALPTPGFTGRTAAIAAGLADAVHRTGSAGETEYDRWSAVPPLATYLVAQLLSPQADDPVVLLERAIDEDLGHLERACHRPETRLLRGTELTVLSRVRRMAPDAIVHLAAHTEDWERRTVKAVHPKRLRALLHEPDPDLYENRIAVLLVDHLLAFTAWRLDRLRATAGVLQELEHLLPRRGLRPGVPSGGSRRRTAAAAGQSDRVVR